jgi:hypothetical protein
VEIGGAAKTRIQGTPKQTADGIMEIVLRGLERADGRRRSNRISGHVHGISRA